MKERKIFKNKTRYLFLRCLKNWRKRQLNLIYEYSGINLIKKKIIGFPALSTGFRSTIFVLKFHGNL